MKGLGSRHNVVKWGDGAKEVRISQAAHWRFFYFLTTDERAGDIMNMVAESAGDAISKYDPMREAAPLLPGEPAVRIRIGPDWFALAGNWMTAWERTNDPRWHDMILAGVDSIVAMPYGLQTGKWVGNSKAQAAIVGFDKATGKLTPIPDPTTKALAPMNYNLATIQGGAEVMFELVPLLGARTSKRVAPEVPHRPRSCRCLCQGHDHGQRRSGCSLCLPARPALAWRRMPTRKQETRRSRRKRSICCWRKEPASRSHTWSAAPTRCIRVEEDATMSTNEAAQTGLSRRFRFWNCARISCPPKRPFDLCAVRVLDHDR